MSANDHRLQIHRLEKLNTSGKALFIPHPAEQPVNELFVVSSGFLIRESNGRRIRVNRYDAHCSVSRQQTAIVEHSADIAGWYCSFTSDIIDEPFLREKIAKELTWINSFLLQYPVRLNRRVARRLTLNLETIDNLGKEYSPDYPLVQPYLIACIAELRMLLHESNPDFFLSKAYRLTMLYRELLQEHYTQQQQAAFYAQQLGITANHLNKSVKAATGKTASDLLNETRLFNAYNLLINTSLTISEIAFRLGFDDPSYFIRFFRKQTGTTPGRIRKER